MGNSSWIVVFSFGARSKAALWLSAVLLLCLVATLMIILERARAWLVVRKTFVHVIALDATFSLYAGWCTVASIVNVTVALASTGWTGATGAYTMMLRLHRTASPPQLGLPRWHRSGCT